MVAISTRAASWMIVRNSNGAEVVDVFDFGESGDDVGENGSVGKEQGGDCQADAAQLRRGVVGGAGGGWGCSSFFLFMRCLSRCGANAGNWDWPSSG